VLLLHYSQLKNDLSSEIHRVAKFLVSKTNELNWNGILEHCSFDCVKMNTNQSTEDIIWVSAAKSFLQEVVQMMSGKMERLL
jgi:aryl sulfotransferase